MSDFRKHKSILTLTVLMILGVQGKSSFAKDRSKDLLLTVKKTPAKLESLSLRPFEVRSRIVRVNFKLVKSLTRKPKATLNLNLFDDVKFLGVVDQFERPYAYSKACSGHLKGQAGTFTLVHHKGIVVANVRSPGNGSYQIRSAGRGFYTAKQIDETKFKECGVGRGEDTGRKITVSSNQISPIIPQVLRDSGSEITVLVVYTPAARDLAAIEANHPAGTKTDIEALIDVCIVETNQAYSNSGIKPRLRLAYRGLEGYDGDSNGGASVYTVLPLFRGKNDGLMDDVHIVRDNRKADLAVLIMVASDAGGLARMMDQGTFNTAFESQAFAVVDMDSASGNYAFGHEIGHVQGNCHDRSNCTDEQGNLEQGVFAYSYGHRYTVNDTLFHTIMSYRPGDLTLHFSNPNISVNGVPTGVPENQSNPCDEAKTINNTASVVANFRVDNP